MNNLVETKLYNACVMHHGLDTAQLSQEYWRCNEMTENQSFITANDKVNSLYWFNIY